MNDPISQRLLAIATQFRLDKPVLIFFTLPALIASGILVLSWILLGIDSLILDAEIQAFPWVPQYDTASSFLGAVAGGAITALSLAYSLTLVVFTLAAGTIGPRLLQRFTSEATIQVTAGVFGGTFLLALSALFFTEPDFVPPLTLSAAALFAILSVAQLIYFVRHVASNVTIDEEIAKIGASLSGEIDELMAVTSESKQDQFRADAALTLCADRDGYLGHVHVKELAALGQRHELRFRFHQAVGDFVLTGMPMVDVLGQQELKEEDRGEIRNCFTINTARSQSQGVDFSLHLLVEIALRALSPGINDTFTAITCVDRLTSALRRPAEKDLDARFYEDDDGNARIFLPGLAVENLIRSVFGPLRNAVGSNFLMAAHLARALYRLDHVACDSVRPLLEREAGLLMQQLDTAVLLPHEISEIAEALGDLLPEDCGPAEQDAKRDIQREAEEEVPPAKAAKRA